MLPKIRVPQNIRRFLPAASCTFVGTWAVGGFYQAFSSSMTVEQLGTNNKLVAAAVFASLMAPNALGAFIVGRMKPDKAQRIGMSAFFLCVMVILVSLKLGATVPFLISSLFAGTAEGIAFTGSMRTMLDKTGQEDRAGVLSTIYLISYSGAAVPNLIVGRISNFFNLLQIAVGYGILVAITCIITLLSIQREAKITENP
jgi:cyanate permease